MRAVLLLILLAACDHRPAPQQQAPVPVAATADAGTAAAPPPAGNDACLMLGAKIAEIIITATTDATQKAAYEQERTKLILRFSENCNREKWSDATRACFTAAKNAADVDACSRALAKPAPPPPAGSGAGSGSAKPPTRD